MKTEAELKKEYRLGLVRRLKSAWANGVVCCSLDELGRDEVRLSLSGNNGPSEVCAEMGKVVVQGVDGAKKTEENEPVIARGDSFTSKEGESTGKTKMRKYSSNTSSSEQRMCWRQRLQKYQAPESELPPSDMPRDY